MASENVNDIKQDREKLRVKNQHYRTTTCDLYFGKANELIATGLVRPEQLPGSEGMPSSAVTFYDGHLIPRGKRAEHDEKYLNIARYGLGFRVFVGVTAKVRAEREAVEKREDDLLSKERDAEKLDQETCKDPGIDEETKRVTDCSAVFAVGDQVLADGVIAEITGEYRLRRVTYEDGEYLDFNGKQITYRPGYVCRLTTGEEFFYGAHQIKFRHDKSRLSYLKIVRLQQQAALVD